MSPASARVEPLPAVSPTAVRLFTAYSRSYVRRRFHSVRILRKGQPPTLHGRPVVFYLNHASWWDPLVCLLLARRYFDDRTSYAPIDRQMLERYAFFKRLGFFGVNSGRTRRFLRTADAILANPNAALWITPQGDFTDVRTRPLQFQSGLGALALRHPETSFVPLAIEYPFWTEPQPEILLAFGRPIVPALEELTTTESCYGALLAGLEETQDTLGASSCLRTTDEWLWLDSGKSGVTPAFDAWQWLRAKLRGGAFHREHLAEVAK